jgi:RNA-directed DNA polymerase
MDLKGLTRGEGQQVSYPWDKVCIASASGQNIDKEHLMEMVGRRIADTRILRLIRKWLNAGVIEKGEWFETEKGTPQGAVISPLLANVYLHYVLDQWTDQWRRNAQGDVIIVRWADDAVIGFQHEYEAKRFLKDLREHL